MDRGLIETMSEINWSGSNRPIFSMAIIYIGFLVALAGLWSVSAWYPNPSKEETKSGEELSAYAIPSSDAALRNIQGGGSEPTQNNATIASEITRLWILQLILLGALILTASYIFKIHLNVEGKRKQKYQKISDAINSRRGDRRKKRNELAGIDKAIRSYAYDLETLSPSDSLIEEMRKLAGTRKSIEEFLEDKKGLEREASELDAELEGIIKEDKKDK